MARFYFYAHSGFIIKNVELRTFSAKPKMPNERLVHAIFALGYRPRKSNESAMAMIEGRLALRVAAFYEHFTSRRRAMHFLSFSIGGRA
jgi:hypothetical protein